MLHHLMDPAQTQRIHELFRLTKHVEQLRVKMPPLVRILEVGSVPPVTGRSSVGMQVPSDTEAPQAMMQRAKTDLVDAEVILAFVERMPFEPWQPPSDDVLQLQSVSRRIEQVKVMLNQELNRRHAHRYRTSAGRCVVQDIDANIRSLRRRVDRLETEGVVLILSTAELAQPFQLARQVKRMVYAPPAIRYDSLLALDVDGTTNRAVWWRWTAVTGHSKKCQPSRNCSMAEMSAKGHPLTTTVPSRSGFAGVRMAFINTVSSSLTLQVEIDQGQQPQAPGVVFGVVEQSELHSP